MKKVLALILAVAMIASVAMLTACGNNANKGNATDAKADADKIKEDLTAAGATVEIK